MDVRSSEQKAVRCAGVPVPRETWMKELEASPDFIERESSAYERDLTGAAAANLLAVWATPSESRYTSGDYPVLYTADTQAVAEAEKAHWSAELWFKKGFTRARKLFMYTCKINGRRRDFLKNWRSNKEIVNPDRYDYCRAIATEAIKDEYAYIAVPSARKLNGVCFPVLKEEAATIDEALFEFELQWDSANAKSYVMDGGLKRMVEIDPVYSLI